jgi:methionine aminotransferase
VIASKLPWVGTTIFTTMSALANECNALNLSQGFPDFGAPPALLEAMARHVRDGHNQYAPMPGVLFLREQIGAQLLRYRGVSSDPDGEITVVPGATEGIYCAVTACVRPGDEVIVFDPCYDSYEPAIALAGGVAVHVPLTPRTFSVDWQRVEAAVTRRTRLVIVNSPHNPSGATLGADDLLQLQDLAERHDLLVISDEVYEHLVFDGQPHHSALQYPQLRQRSFVLFSFGKTFSVTGWKIGWAVGPAVLNKALRAAHQWVTFATSTPMQQATAVALEQAIANGYYDQLRAEYDERRLLLRGILEGVGLPTLPVEGSYFISTDISALGYHDDGAFCRWLTAEIGVAAIPTSAFYSDPASAPPFARFCFAKKHATLEAAGERLQRLRDNLHS